MSYSWGDAADPKLIQVNGRIVEVRRNLYDALQALSDEIVDDPLILWADALCINQNDNDEKSHQVGMMRDIYRGAEEVVVWLGHPPAREQLADARSKKEYEEIRKILGQIYLNKGNARLSVVSLPPYDESYTPAEDLDLPIVITMSGSAQEERNDGAEHESSTPEELDEKIDRTFGITFLRGLVPSELQYWLPDNMPEAAQDTIYRWLQAKHFGSQPTYELHFSENSPDEEEYAEGVSKHITRLQALEDYMLEASAMRRGDSEDKSWDYGQSGSIISAYFLNAYQKGVVTADYHIVGAFCLLGLLASDTHFHELFFFDPQSTQRVFYPSMLWRHSVKALVDLLEQPYWSRIWIVQEILLAKSARFRYGEHTAPVQLVKDACRGFAEHYLSCCNKIVSSEADLHTCQWGRLINAFLSIDSFMTIPDKVHELELQDLLIPRLSFRNATDPRDFVYGVLGLVGIGNGRATVPDYNKTPKNVFIEAAVTVLNDDGTLDMLRKLEWTAQSDQLPSWVPDWGHQGFRKTTNDGGSYSYIVAGHPNAYYQLFNACGGRPANFCLTQETMLEVEGTAVDTISKVYEHVSNSYTANMAGAILAILEWSDALQHGEEKVSEEVFWFTIFGGCMRHDQGYRLLHQDDFAAIKAWMRAVLKESDTGAAAMQMWSDTEHNLITRWLSFFLIDKQLFLTENGRLGLGNVRGDRLVQKGDKVYVLDGFRMPVLLRTCTSSHPDPAETEPSSSVSSEILHSVKSNLERLDISSKSGATSDLEPGGSRPLHPLCRYMNSCYIHGIMQGEILEEHESTTASVFLV